MRSCISVRREYIFLFILLYNDRGCFLYFHSAVGWLNKRKNMDKEWTLRVNWILNRQSRMVRREKIYSEFL